MVLPADEELHGEGFILSGCKSDDSGTRATGPSYRKAQKPQMNKPTLRVSQQQPRSIQRADIAPEHGYSMVVDGHSLFGRRRSYEGGDRLARKIPHATPGDLQCEN